MEPVLALLLPAPWLVLPALLPLSLFWGDFGVVGVWFLRGADIPLSAGQGGDPRVLLGRQDTTAAEELMFSLLLLSFPSCSFAFAFCFLFDAFFSVHSLLLPWNRVKDV